MIDFGITAAEFRERHFEKQPFLFRGALTKRPIGWPELDQLLGQIEPTPAGMQLFHGGLVPADSYVEEVAEFGQRRRRLNKIRFYGHMRSGATFVINRLETHSAAARHLCVEVGQFTGFPVTGNAYLSFSGDGTFGKHWDTHDVFAVQLVGRKRWRLFSPTLPLPLSHQTSDRSDVPCPSLPQIDCVLESGDVLYVPRGWWHQVTPLEEGSLHFSIGVYAPTTQDYLAWLCSRVVPQSVAGRTAVDAMTQEQMTALLQTLSAAAADPSLRAEFNQSLATKEVLTAEFNTELFLNRRMPLLAETARLRLTTRQTPDEQGRLSVHGAVLQLDRTGAAIVRMLAAAGDRTFAEIVRQLREIPREAVHRSLLDLMGREILTLD